MLERSDFDRWLRDHAQACDLPESLPTSAAADAWFDALDRFDANELRAATSAMLAGTLKRPAKPSQHVELIRTFCMGRRIEEARGRPQQIVDGEPVYNCRNCLDTGYATVFAPRAMRAMRDDPEAFTPADSRVCAVACNCKRGDLRAMGPGRKLPQYDERKMLLVRGELIADIERLRQFVVGDPALFD